MSEYYELKGKASFEALGDMQLDTIDVILDFANKKIDELQKGIESCDLRSILYSSNEISIQVEYARDILNSGISIILPDTTELYNKKIFDVRMRAVKMISSADAKCKCLVK